MANLSDNFSLAELTHSDTARRKGIDNEPSYEQLEALQYLAQNLLQPIRDHFGKPVHITSGFRSETLNKSIGGSRTSQHCKGEAADFRVSGIHPRRVWEYINSELEFDQLIAEYIDRNETATGWIHCSLKKKDNRGEAASITRKYGYKLGFHYDK